MKKTWLTHRITTKISKTEFKDSKKDLRNVSDPFNLETYNWDNLKSQMKEGDELWVFSSPNDTWRNLSGRAGVCIVRDGEIIKSEVSVLN